jgi:hypothetical protein
MRPETELIWRLVGKLIDEGTWQLTSVTTQGKQPRTIANRIKRYDAEGFDARWTFADDEILVLNAMSDLMWESRIELLADKDEEVLQVELGVNLLSRAATAAALTRMRTEEKDLKALQTQCEALPPLALAMVFKSTMAAPADASQVALNRMGADRVRTNCNRNKAGIGDILQKLQRVIPVTEQWLRVHEKR